MERPPRSDYISRLGTPADYCWARSDADTREERSRGRLRFGGGRVSSSICAGRHITRPPILRHSSSMGAVWWLSDRDEQTDGG